jgi:hypothetical protein
VDAGGERSRSEVGPESARLAERPDLPAVDADLDLAEERPAEAATRRFQRADHAQTASASLEASYATTAATVGNQS